MCAFLFTGCYRCTCANCRSPCSSFHFRIGYNTLRVSVRKVQISLSCFLVSSNHLDEHVANNFATLRSKIRRLPPIHQATLKALVEHLSRVASHSDKNKMDPKNLAIVFGSVIFGEDEIPKGADLLGMQAWKV